MIRCRSCKVPLNGILGGIAARLFRISPSPQDPRLCNKCAQDVSDGKTGAADLRSPSGKYRCQVCDRDIDESAALVHIKTEEYLIELIKKDHPHWAKDKKTCKECLDYYRRLVKEAEI